MQIGVYPAGCIVVVDNRKRTYQTFDRLLTIKFDIEMLPFKMLPFMSHLYVQLLAVFALLE